jgi:HSP20 family molecular chaperone IbpA
MKIVPRRSRNTEFFDDVFDTVFKSPLFALSDKIVKMQTDLREKDGYYILDIDVAGFNKEDIAISIEEGYLTVTATSGETITEENEQFIRKERHTGSCSRSYYVGETTEADIRAAYVNGILTITFPVENEKVESKKFIPIE